jgi:hypothetical protein
MRPDIVMDSASQQATIVLAALVECRDKGRALAQKLEAVPEAQAVTFEFDCYRNHSHHAFDSGSPYIFGWVVDVFIRDNAAIWWSLDVTWDNVKWIIEAKVEVPADPGPITVKQFPERYAETVNEFVRELEEAGTELLNSADLIATQL